MKKNEVRTRGELLRGELGETVDHALRAAGHAAGGVGAAVRPRVAAARSYVAPATDRLRGAATNGWGSTRAAFAPLAEAARAKVKDPKAPATSRRRWPAVVGVLATGAAAGVFGALLLRRRRRRWEGLSDQAAEPVEQEPAEPVATSEPR